MKQLALPLGIDPVRGFDNFEAGSNALALDHLRSLAAGLGDGAPVYLWGPPGCGKTHLLEAAAQAWRQRRRPVCWFGHSSELDHALDIGLAAAPALVVLDDCQAYDAERQHAAFALFVEATGLALPVLAAGRVPPVDLPLRDDLRTRLGWGHVLALKPLNEAETRTALRREALHRGLSLSDDVIDFLLRRFDRDLKHLVERLDAFDAYALAERRAPTVQLLRQMLSEPAPMGEESNA